MNSISLILVGVIVGFFTESFLTGLALTCMGFYIGNALDKLKNEVNQLKNDNSFLKKIINEKLESGRLNPYKNNLNVDSSINLTEADEVSTDSDKVIGKKAVSLPLALNTNNGVKVEEQEGYQKNIVVSKTISSSDHLLETRSNEKANTDEPKYNKQNNQNSRVNQSTANRPSLFDQFVKLSFNKIKSFFTEGNPLVRIGSLVLLFAVGLLLKYVSQRVYFPVEYRLVGAALLGVLMVIWGWSLRFTRRNFSLPIQGAGFGSVYIVIFAAFNFYQLLPEGVALVLLVACVIAMTALALMQDARVLALIALIGGLIAPIIIPYLVGSSLGLFSYYLILNVFVAFLVWRKNWAILFRLSFLFTMGCGIYWVLDIYRTEDYKTAQFFLMAFVFLYIFIACRTTYLNNQNTQLEKIVDISSLPLLSKSTIDGSVVYGTAFIGFLIQNKLLEYLDNSIGISALVFFVIYFISSIILKINFALALKMLQRVFLIISGAFITLAIPDFFSAGTTLVIWSIEGASLLWLGLIQKDFFARLVGILLMILGSALYFYHPDLINPAALFLNTHYFHVLVIMITSWLSFKTVLNNSMNIGEGESYYLLRIFPVFASLWLLFGSFQQIYNLVKPSNYIILSLFVLSIGALIPLLVSFNVKPKIAKANRESNGLSNYLFSLSNIIILIIPIVVITWIDTLVNNLNNNWFFNVSFLSIGCSSFLLLFWGWMNHVVNYSGLNPSLRILKIISSKFEQQKQQSNSMFPKVFLITSGLIWIIGLLLQTAYQTELLEKWHIFMALVVISFAFVYLLSNVIDWNDLKNPLAKLPIFFWVSLLIVCVFNISQSKVFGYSCFYFVISLCIYYYLLDKNENVSNLSSSPMKSIWFEELNISWHWQNYYFLLVFLVIYLSHLIKVVFDVELVPYVIGCLFACVVFLFSSFDKPGNVLKKYWPINQNDIIYSSNGVRVLIYFLLAWLILINLDMLISRRTGLYIPFLNWQDISILLVFLSIFKWFSTFKNTKYIDKLRISLGKTRVLIAVILFYSINALVLRIDSQIFDVPYKFGSLMSSDLVQVSLTFLWVITGLIVMILSNKLLKPKYWLVGTGILGMSLIKLLIIDTANSNTIERIVAFFVVAVGYIAAGYFVPRPAQK